MPPRERTPIPDAAEAEAAAEVGPLSDAASGGAEESLSYEQAREELIETVRRLEAGGTSLEESLALWERGEHLASVCQRFLDGVRQRLDAAVAADEEPTD